MTDNQTAVVRMSSLAGSALMKAEGLEPNFQMVCRDRNRLAMMSDILGAYALGVRNMLCLSGDHQSFGNHPEAKNVHDIDSMQLIALVKKMRDEEKFLNGEDIDMAPRMFIGAACNPFADPFEFRVHRLATKIAAGADFIQTQCIFNMDKFRDFMKQVKDKGLHEKCYILAGVTPMKNAGMASFMSKYVPGMDIPESLIKRLKGVDKRDQAEEGIKIALEQIEAFKEMQGVAGVHLMAIEWEHKVPEIAERAGVLPRP
jgi:methylenetetrahydrofolate reductase (NADPH)